MTSSDLGDPLKSQALALVSAPARNLKLKMPGRAALAVLAMNRREKVAKNFLWPPVTSEAT